MVRLAFVISVEGGFLRCSFPKPTRLIHRTKSQFLRASARVEAPSTIFLNPSDFGRSRKIGVNDQPRSLGSDEFGMTFSTLSISQKKQLSVDLARRCIVKCLASLRIPNKVGSRLISDADCSDLICPNTYFTNASIIDWKIWEVQISSGSCSTQPCFGKCCLNSFWAVKRFFLFYQKTIARELVVPCQAKVYKVLCFGSLGFLGWIVQKDSWLFHNLFWFVHWVWNGFAALIEWQLSILKCFLAVFYLCINRRKRYL